MNAVRRFDPEPAEPHGSRSAFASQIALVHEALGLYTWRWHVETGTVEWSADPAPLLGVAPGEFSGKFSDYLERLHPDDRQGALTTYTECLKGVRPTYRSEERIIRPDGSVRWLETCGRGCYVNGRGVELVGVVRDVTDRRESEARVRYLASHDSLTGLPTRSLLRDRLGHALASGRRVHQTLAVLVVGLDRFKHINDSLGHPAGDVLLKVVSSRLTECLRKGDTVARLGGDVFVAMLEDLKSPAGAASAARKIQEALAEPLAVAGQHVSTSACVGIAVHPTDGADVDTLLMHADAAMHQAKDRGRNGCQFFSSELNTRAQERARIELDVRRALRAGDFRLEFQPVFALGQPRPAVVEALLRWTHAERGAVSPADFIPVAEDMGLIVEIGDWVLDQALRQVAAWRAAGHGELRVAVNVSPRQLAHSELFDGRVAELLAAHGVPARCLELEITEHSLAQDIDTTSGMLARLANKGVRLALDDFGTGYSSLSYLQSLPLHTLKIDRGFVRDMDRRTGNAALVRTIITMAHTFGMRVVAEGVETQKQLEILRAMGCDDCQGYFLSQPLEASALAQRFLQPPALA